MKITIIIPAVLGWSYSVHRQLGTYLEEYLKINDQHTHFNMIKTLEGLSFRDASVWADKAKRTTKFRWTHTYHYTNINECNITELPSSGLLLGLSRFSENSDVFTEKERLMFVLHLLQETAQPLHFSGILKGGNGFEIIRNRNGRNRTTNLHSLWDSEIGGSLTNYTLPGCSEKVSLLDIVNTALRANCDWVFPSSHFILYSDYYDEDYLKNSFDRYICFASDYFKKYFGSMFVFQEL